MDKQDSDCNKKFVEWINKFLSISLEELPESGTYKSLMFQLAWLSWKEASKNEYAKNQTC